MDNKIKTISIINMVITKIMDFDKETLDVFAIVKKRHVRKD
jgi:hypothetical protein